MFTDYYSLGSSESDPRASLKTEWELGAGVRPNGGIEVLPSGSKWSLSAFSVTSKTYSIGPVSDPQTGGNGRFGVFRCHGLQMVDITPYVVFLHSG